MNRAVPRLLFAASCAALIAAAVAGCGFLVLVQLDRLGRFRPRRVPHPLQRPARTDDRSAGQGLRRRDGRLGGDPLRRGRGAGRPDRAGGLGVPRRRRPHREHAAGRSAGRERAAGQGRHIDPRRSARPVQLAERPLGRRRGARDGDGLQPEADRRSRTAGLDPRPGRTAVEGQAGDRALGARLRAVVRRRKCSTARPRRSPGSKASPPTPSTTTTTRGSSPPSTRARSAPGSSTTTTGSRRGPRKARARFPSKLHYFGNEDPGALVDISGAAALASSDDPELAQEFLAYVTSPEGQEAMTHSGDWEYPLNSAATAAAGADAVRPSSTRRR